jgi:hypothetical protein
MDLQPPDYYFERALQSAQARQSRHETAVTCLHRAELYLITERQQDAVALLDQAQTDFTDMAMFWHLDQARQLRLKLR